MQTTVHYENGCHRGQFIGANGQKWGVRLEKFIALNGRCAACDKKASKELQDFEVIPETDLRRSV